MKKGIFDLIPELSEIMRTFPVKKQTQKPMPKNTVLEFEGIPFEVIYRRVKYSRVEFKPAGLRVVVPRGVDPFKVLKDNKVSVLGKYHQLMKQIQEARQTPVNDSSYEGFLEIVTKYSGRFSKQLDVEIKAIKYRKMKRRWGSCRSDGIITFNSFLQFVPEHLIAYIIYHELAHLVVKGHNKQFKAIIARQFPNYRQLDKELNIYGLKLLS